MQLCISLKFHITRFYCSGYLYYIIIISSFAKINFNVEPKPTMQSQQPW